MRNGIFLAPFHPLDEDPTEAIHRDLDLVVHLDRLGFEEAWIGAQRAVNRRRQLTAISDVSHS